jgi:hypothetical protein
VHTHKKKKQQKTKTKKHTNKNEKNKKLSSPLPDKMRHLFYLCPTFFEGLDKEGQLLTPHFVRTANDGTSSAQIRGILPHHIPDPIPSI